MTFVDELKHVVEGLIGTLSRFIHCILLALFVVVYVDLDGQGYFDDANILFLLATLLAVVSKYVGEGFISGPSHRCCFEMLYHGVGARCCR